MKTKTMVSAALLSAISFIIRQFSFPFVIAPFLKMEFSEVPVLLAGMLFGPGTGLFVQAIKDILLVLIRGSALWGVFSDFVSGGTLVLFFSLIGRRNHETDMRALAVASIVSITLRCIISIPLNYLVLSLQFGNDISYITSILAPAILPFNAFKSVCNIALFIPIYQLIKKKYYLL
ncbi:MAG: ECF transporter S component [Lawsonibacter sp.]|nr:ECF transporter S component [Lawsonibacter sp.]